MKHVWVLWDDIFSASMEVYASKALALKAAKKKKLDLRTLHSCSGLEKVKVYVS